MKGVFERRMCRRIGVAAVAIAVAVSAAPASGQIVGGGGRGRIEWHSGFFPWQTPPGAIRIPPVLFATAPLPLVLPNVFHLSPFGYAEGSGALGVAANAAQYRVIIPAPPITHLLQLQSRPSLAATLDFEYDTFFRMGAGGFPAHITRLAYPVVGINGPGNGSFFWARGSAQVFGFDNANRLIWVRNLQFNFLDIVLGPFARLLSSQAPVPATPAGGRIAVRGFLRFQALGKPPLFGAAAGKGISNGNNALVDLNGANGSGMSKGINETCTDIMVNSGAADGGLPVMGLDPCLPQIVDNVPPEDYPQDLLQLVDSMADTPFEEVTYPDQEACTE